MTPRDRQLASIRRQRTDRISLDCICIEIVPQIAEYLGIEQGEVLDALGIDGRIIAAGYSGEPGRGPEGQPLNDWATLGPADYGTAHWSPLADAETVAEVDAHPWPDPGAYDYAAVAGLAAEWGERYALRGPYWLPLFCRVCELMGMERAMVQLAAAPVVFEAALEAVFVRVEEYCRRLLDACGDALPILCLGDDFATQRGLMISPDDWRRTLKPRFARLFEVGKSRGKLVWFHSCGDVTPILRDLIEIGVDVWETVQLQTLPMSAQELKREFGRDLTFFGGVSTQRLPFITPGEVREEVRRCIATLGEGGGYVCGPDHHIKPDVPVENAVALFEEARGC